MKTRSFSRLALVVLALFVPVLRGADGGQPATIIVTEPDGTPRFPARVLEFPNGSVTQSGSKATIATGGGGSSYTFSTPLLDTSGTVSIVNAAADGSTKGAATFLAADFDSTNGLLSIDYVNAQKATGSVNGLLLAADWTTFNSKLSAASIDTAAELAAIMTDETGTSGGFVRDTGGTLTSYTFTAEKISRTSSGNLGSSKAFDVSAMNIYVGTLNSASCAVTFTNWTNNVFCYVTIGFTQDATGGRLITLAAAVQNTSAVAALVSTTASATTWITFWSIDNGTTIFASLVSNQNAGTKTIARLDGDRPWGFPTSNFATWAAIGEGVLPNFANGEIAIWRFVISQGVVLTSTGLIFYLDWGCESTSGNVAWDFNFARTTSGTGNVKSLSYGSTQSISAVTVAGTSGLLTRSTITVSQANLPSSLAAGDTLWIKLTRPSGTASLKAWPELLEVQTP